MVKLNQNVISVLVPVMNEVDSLTKTIEIIKEDSPDVDFEFVIVLSPKSTKSAAENALRIKSDLLENCSVIVQRYPGLGGAYAHAIEVSTGDYILMIASDLETDPKLVKSLIAKSQEFPNAIITTTRWRGHNAGFKSYGNTKKFLNYIFQKWISILYRANLTDYTFGFRMYPSQALRSVEWQSTNFAFLLESILVPVRRGFQAIEIPHYWRPREEGHSNNQARFFVDYFKIAIKIRKSI